MFLMKSSFSYDNLEAIIEIDPKYFSLSGLMFLSSSIRGSRFPNMDADDDWSAFAKSPAKISPLKLIIIIISLYACKHEQVQEQFMD